MNTSEEFPKNFSLLAYCILRDTCTVMSERDGSTLDLVVSILTMAPTPPFGLIPVSIDFQSHKAAAFFGSENFDEEFVKVSKCFLSPNRRR